MLHKLGSQLVVGDRIWLPGRVQATITGLTPSMVTIDVPRIEVSTVDDKGNVATRRYRPADSFTLVD